MQSVVEFFALHPVVHLAVRSAVDCCSDYFAAEVVLLLPIYFAEGLAVVDSAVEQIAVAES